MAFRRFMIVLALLAAGSGLLFAGLGIATPAATVSLVKTAIIPTTKLEALKAAYEAQGAKVSALEILQSLINEELLVQGAQKDGIALTEEQKTQLLDHQKASIEQQVGQALTDEQFQQLLQAQAGMTVSEYKESLARQYAIQSFVTMRKQDMFRPAALLPDEKAVTSFFRKNASQFVNPEAVKVAVVLIHKTDSADQDAKNAATLKGALDEIKAGKLTFEKAVGLYSQDEASKSNSGQIGWLTIDNEDYRNLFGEEFYDAVFDLDDGEIAPEVIESNIGPCIVKVLMHTYFKVLGLDDPISPTESATVRQFIVDRLQQQKAAEIFQEATGQLLAELSKEAKIKIMYKEAD